MHVYYYTFRYSSVKKGIRVSACGFDFWYRISTFEELRPLLPQWRQEMREERTFDVMFQNYYQL